MIEATVAFALWMTPQLLPAVIDPAEPPLRFVGRVVPEGTLSTGYAWSPTGHRIALHDSSGLVIVDPDSLDRPLRLPIGRTTSFAWRQDGALLACRTQSLEQSRRGRASLVVVSLGDGTKAEIIKDAEVGYLAFDSVGNLHVWQRDGVGDSVIVPPIGHALLGVPGRAQGTFIPRWPRGVDGAGLWYFDGDGSPDRVMASHIERPALLPRIRIRLDAVPDSSRFLVAAKGGSALHTLIVDERGQTVQDLGPRIPGEFVGNSISSDGGRVLGVIAGAGEEEDRPQAMAILNVSTRRTRLVRGPTAAMFPQWSRDGKFVAYLEASTGTLIGTIAPE